MLQDLDLFNRPKIAFLQRAVAEEWPEARAAVSKATPPTVTLPRIKVGAQGPNVSPIISVGRGFTGIFHTMLGVSFKKTASKTASKMTDHF